METELPARETLPSIGIVKIWAEAEGFDRLSPKALVGHIFRRAYGNILMSPLTSTLTTLTIGTALFLVGLFLLVLGNARDVVVTNQGDVSVAVFLKDEITEKDLNRMEKDLEKLPEVTKVFHRTKELALSTFKESLGEDGKILEGLEEDNPLPASLDITIKDPINPDGSYEKIKSLFSDNRYVENIRYSRGLAYQLQRILKVVEVGGTAAVVFLLIVTGFIIANTIKLALYSHRTEIEIMQLVGAAPVSIQLPYILEGLFQGIFGALLSLVLTFITYLVIQDVLSHADLIRFIFPKFHFLSFSAIFLIIAAGMLVGAVGSFLAANRFLHDR